MIFIACRSPYWNKTQPTNMHILTHPLIRHCVHVHLHFPYTALTEKKHLPQAFLIFQLTLYNRQTPLQEYDEQFC